MLEARHVSYKVRQKSLIRNVDLRASAGRIVAIVGPNGAGKSTLLKVLAGELRPSTGLVMLDGVPISELSAGELAERRAVMPQSTELAFPFTVKEVVGLGRSVPGFANVGLDRDAAVTDAMRCADITPLANRTYTTLSGGERQRVHLARAICQLEAAPNKEVLRVLLLDEPTASLDIAHQILILDEARRMANSRTVVIAVLHDLNLASTYADQVVLMSDGRIVASGPAKRVLTDALLSDVFGCVVRTNELPKNGVPFVLPQLCRLGENSGQPEH